ncbi:MAG: DUF4926 domain-containing protein [Cyanobacteria bacterium P01_D01_bin.115]
MTTQYPLFSQVALAADLPEHHLKRGDVTTVVEHYPMPKDEEDGYSLEGFNVPGVTVEVTASQIMSLDQWQQEQLMLEKLRRLPLEQRSLLNDFIDFLLQKETIEETQG